LKQFGDDRPSIVAWLACGSLRSCRHRRRAFRYVRPTYPGLGRSLRQSCSGSSKCDGRDTSRLSGHRAAPGETAEVRRLDPVATIGRQHVPVQAVEHDGDRLHGLILPSAAHELQPGGGNVPLFLDGRYRALQPFDPQIDLARAPFVHEIEAPPHRAGTAAQRQLEIPPCPITLPASSSQRSTGSRQSVREGSGCATALRQRSAPRP
jgi:hypothetical protein